MSGSLLLAVAFGALWAGLLIVSGVVVYRAVRLERRIARRKSMSTRDDSN